MNRKFYEVTIFLIGMLMLMIMMPEVTANGSRYGMKLWLESIVPTMLPFFLLTNIIKNLGLPSMLPWKLYPFVIAMLSGYPVGAKISAEYYRDDQITYEELLYLLSYSMVTGPAFIIGAIGVEFIGSIKWGVAIALGHYFGAIANGVIYKKPSKLEYKKTGDEAVDMNISKALSESIGDSFKSIFIILAYIIIFVILLNFINQSNVFRYILLALPKHYRIIAEGIFKGLFEMTIGCKVISYSSMSKLVVSVVTSFLISFGGLSVIGQSLTMTAGCNVKPFELIKMKLTHGILAALLTFSFGTFVIYF